jgi:hypothetical protein
MNLITEWDPEVLPGTEENLGDWRGVGRLGCIRHI